MLAGRATTKPGWRRQTGKITTLNELTLTLAKPQNNTAMTLPQAKYSQLGGTRL